MDTVTATTVFILFALFVGFIVWTLSNDKKIAREKQQRSAKLTETIELRKVALAQAREELDTIKKEIEGADMLGQSTASLRVRELSSEELIAGLEKLITMYIDSSRPVRKSNALICPHCQTQGNVTTSPIKVKTGVSGGKATAAVLTGGLSLFAVGLSRKQAVTSAHCSHCGSTWTF
jgi:hypothetical protein